MLGRGRGAIIGTFFGALWLAFGLAVARAFSLLVIVIFATGFITLAAGATRLIHKGKALRAQLGGRPGARSAKFRKQFIGVTIAETVACVAVAWACSAANRPVWIPVGIAAIVGLHFLPLAKIFATRIYYATGIGILACCAASVIFYRAQAIDMDIAAGIGTGMVLWLSAAYGLLYARRFARPVFATSSAPPTNAER